MQGRELVERTLRGESHGSHAFWVGHPTAEAMQLYRERLGLTEREKSTLELHNEESSVLLCDQVDDREIEFDRRIGSDMVWITPELDMGAWKHPEGRPMWDCFRGKRESLGAAGIFADCEDTAEVDAFPWPNPDYLDFSGTEFNTRLAWDRGFAVFGGMWCPFFHIVADFFGMENYFVKMYTDPEVVHAVTRHVVDFLLEANRRCLTRTAGKLSAGFFGNDFGTQISTLIGLDSFDEFLLPYIREIIATIQAWGLPVAVHSCGAIEPLIPRFLDAGVNILHPLQARARGMDAETLSAKYRGKVIFMGGVDTQELLPFGKPAQIRDEVLRLRDVFGSGYIVSPSHEALLPCVPFENVVAMSEAAKE